MSDCVFCRIVAGGEPATVIYQDDWAVVIEPLNPVVEGHAIAIPRQHAADFTESWIATSNAMHAAFQYGRIIGQDCNLIISKGLAATQSVFHLHVHVVPRRVDDGLALPWHSGKSRVRAS